MNKKFSTLVAMLLASGGLFYAVDAMVLPGSEGVAKYVTMNVRSTVVGDNYSIATGALPEDLSSVAVWTLEGSNQAWNLKTDKSYLCVEEGNIVLKKAAEAGTKLVIASLEQLGDKYVVKTSDDKYLTISGTKLALGEEKAAGLALFTGSDKEVVTALSETSNLVIATPAVSNAFVAGSNAAVKASTATDAVLGTATGVACQSASAYGTGVTHVAVTAIGETGSFALQVTEGGVFAQLNEAQDAIEYVTVKGLVAERAELAVTAAGALSIGGQKVFVEATGLALEGSKVAYITNAALAANMTDNVQKSVSEISWNGSGDNYLLGTAAIGNVDTDANALKFEAAEAPKLSEDKDATFDVLTKWTVANNVICSGYYNLKAATATDDAAVSLALSAATPVATETVTLDADGAIKVGGKFLYYSEDYKINESVADAKKLYFYSDANTIVTDLKNVKDCVISDKKTAVVLGTTGVNAISEHDATPADNLPGLEQATVDTEGKVTAIEEDAKGNLTVPAPFYFKAGNTYLSVTKDKAGKFVIAEGEDAITAEPTAAQSAAASWKLVDGKLLSVAAERAGESLYLKAVETRAVVENFNYTLVGYSEAPNVTLENSAVKFGNVVTSANLYVSATSVDINNFIITSDGIVVGGTQKVSYQTLLTSVPSGYAIIGVKQASGMEYLYANTDGSVTTETFNGSNYEGYLWKVSETNDNKKVYYYQFTSLRKNAAGNAIQWIIDGRAQFTGGVKYEGNGFTLSHPSGNITEAGTADPAGIKAVIGFYEAPLGAFTLNYLNDILKPGFEMSVEIEKDSKDKLENIDIFSGKMYPNETAANSNTFVLWNNKDFAGGTDAKMLVLNKASIDGDNAKGAFEWITKKAYDKDPSNYETNFQFLYDLSNPTTDVVSKVKVGSYTLSVLEVEKKFYLTSVKTVTDNTKLPYIKLGANNVYPVKNLLGKLWNISYADTKANAKADDEEYKLNGILAVTYKNGNVADYVASNTVAEAAPEAQWIVTSADLNSNTFTLTNREKKEIEITGVKLRLRDGNKFEVYGTTNTNLEEGDIIYLTESVKKDNFQGYMQTTENTLRSNNYFLGQYHAIGGNHNAYFVENHANSHQIGAVADQDAADKWKLHFALKADDDNKYTEVDTVKIITPYATLNAAGNGWETDSKKIKRDTLYILPYTFQKVANREFVAFNPENKTNMDFYACDEENKDNGVGNYTKATRFALKVKPNGYNFVEITTNSDEEYALLSSNKAYLANSAENGSLERMEAYAPDNNSVMVVEAADASEYHKIAQAWGDTIKLFRDENNAQVMFEKFDAKSIVANDTLSFLNIDNVNQFNVNPAIFADTAYINRWDADGVLNTTYQYLLTLNPSFGLHTEDCEIPGHEPIVGGIDTVYGRFLVNLIDTANVYGVNHIHNNWYINESEAGEKLAKLSFVEGYHTNDTLYLTRQGGEIVKIGMTDPAFNVAKFAFRYVDSDAKTFKIQTQFKKYLADENEYDSAEEFARAYANNPSLVSNEGYLKWINGTVVVTEGYENGDVFGIEENYAGNPTANENVTVSGISVVATNGAVIIKGAEGKKVSIVNVLGQTIANTVITSSEATIAAPAGVVVVSVEGEAAVKAIVK